MRLLLFIAFLSLVSSCKPGSSEEKQTNSSDIEFSADKFAKDILIIDTHIDLPYRISNESKEIDVSKDFNTGHFDYPKAINGGLNVAFMSIYTPPSLDGNEAFQAANSLINLVDSISEKFPGKFQLIYGPDDIVNKFDNEIIYLPLGMENGSPINNDLENLVHFYNKGIRYITLCHFKSNEICDSSTDDIQPHGGLSEFGYNVVKKMNQLGILVDVSHVSDETVEDVLEITKDPVIASHSGCRQLTPGFPRNLPDHLIKRIGENDGVIMVNFGSMFLNSSSASNANKMLSILNERSVEVGSDEGNKLMKELEKELPIQSSVDDIVDHIDHIVKIAGIDHVGFGSDFDGVSYLPEEVKNVSDYPVIIEALKTRGYSNTDIEKICGKNFLRVWEKVANK
ncbi:dipeptidase [Mangrovivirga cuniculi]|uniref:Peptidase M19 n=1 Tax=Mangrovivirga cuniculi TaxID=2715131 RepID=A0A4D7K3X2_9BACT|nr:dipeptidase [Mangrovivirga cuniculi]QCK14128.1 peptidase M19 [Mangrovivirga cuniculi]